MRNAHLPLRPRCGACADRIFRHERVVALSGNDDSTICTGHTRPFPFPQHGMVRTWVDGRLLCRSADCTACAGAPEFITVHYACYQIFRECSRQAFNLEEHEILDRLWTVASWRNPWPRAQHIHLVEEAIDLPAFARTATVSGIPQFSRLPQELVSLIRNLSRHELFWRSISVIALSLERQLRPLSRIPVGQILSWNRGKAPVVYTTSARLPPYIRLTIDLRGICEIEHLHERPLYTFDGTVADSVAFIVELTRDMRDIDAELKDGLLRLRLPENKPHLQIWNIQNPPNLATCKLLNPADPKLLPSGLPPRLNAVDFNHCRGLTFFFSSGKLFGIHAHQLEDSSAMDTYEQFPPRRQQNMAWIYMPIAPRDRIIVLGSRRTDSGFNILVRTKLVGEIILGQLGRRSEQDRLLGYGVSTTLIYGEPKELQPVSVFGAHCLPSKGDGSAPLPFSIQDFKPAKANAYFSWAPLSGIQAIRIFYDNGTGLCKGMIFHYENGGLRAVGQCRQHIDCSTLAVRPSTLCFQPACYQSSQRLEHDGVRVAIVVNATHKHVVGGWKCLPLGHGVLTFCFTANSSYIFHQIHLSGQI